MYNNDFSVQKAKQIDLVQYLEILGYKPERLVNQNYWYSSPFRDEKTPSFKVNTKINCWYDFGTGKGGTIIDFGIEYFKCNVSQFLERLRENNHFNQTQNTTFYRVEGVKPRVEESKAGKIKIIDFHLIHSTTLIDYFKSRSINLDIAKRYCQEVDFELYNRRHSAIGFKNDRGGFELRNQYFKGSSSPKSTTLFHEDSSNKSLAVFEGFFNFLSYKTDQKINQDSGDPLSERQANFLILNSLSFAETSKVLMDRHQRIKIFFDRDKAGIQHTRKLLLGGDKYSDGSQIYKGFKDYNDMLTNKPFREEYTQRFKRRL